MAGNTITNVHQDLDAVCALFSSVAQRISTTIHNKTDKLVNVTQLDDIPRFAEIGTPGAAHQLEEVIKEAFDVFDYRMRTNHPRFFSFIPSPASPLSWLGESLVSAFNTFANCKLEGSGPSVIEKSLIKWLAERVGLPSTAGGVFVSGGSMANLTAMVVARDQLLPRGKESLGVAYISSQTHSSVGKALRILGFYGNQIHRVETNSNFEMEPKGLADAICGDRAEGRLPFVVIASCGTTNTGTIDPLAEIAEVCRKEKVWMHVDGAYGASAALAPSRAHLVSGLQHADSLSWDAHKWLFQTYGCGLILVKDKKHLLDSFATDAEYLRDVLEEEDVPNFWNYGIELTRPARAMKLWFTMRVLGADMMGNMIEQGFLLTEKAEEELRKRSDWEITSPTSLAILTFRYAPRGKSENELKALNMAISRRLFVDNIAGILTTELRGIVVLRICAINPWLDETQMADVVERMDKIARVLHFETHLQKA